MGATGILMRNQSEVVQIVLRICCGSVGTGEKISLIVKNN